MSSSRGWFALSIAVLVSAALSSCGRKAPWFAPAANIGTLIVLSSPDSAEILLDGAPAGITPDTLRELSAGTHVVRVRRDGWVPSPESLWVEVAPQATARAEFALSRSVPAVPEVVLLEAFSNVSCVGCPEMTATLRALMAEPGFGLDRVLLVEYATNWPAINDPHYQAATAQNTARMAFYRSYLSFGIPTLVLDGTLAGASGQPPSLDALRALVTTRLARDPGVDVQVSATTTAGGGAIAARATLRARRAVARSGAVLDFALVQDPVVYASPPGNQSETEFHWIMRDFVQAAQSPLPLAPGDSSLCTGTLTRQVAWPAAALHVVAFVQDPQTREILQAGHTVITEAALSSGRRSSSAGVGALVAQYHRTGRGGRP